nr:MAG TPA: hypothetical protein [Caudoviricetes sp.]
MEIKNLLEKDPSITKVNLIGLIRNKPLEYSLDGNDLIIPESYSELHSIIKPGYFLSPFDKEWDSVKEKFNYEGPDEKAFFCYSWADGFFGFLNETILGVDEGIAMKLNYDIDALF